MNHPRCVWLLALMLLAPLAGHAAGPSVSANSVWIREAQPETKAMTGFLVLSNHTNTALALSTITSPDFGAISVRGSGTHTFQTGTHLVIPAHASIKLTPDGNHLVLTKPAKPLFDGDLVTLTLGFSDGSSLTIMAPVRQQPPAH